MQKLEERNTYTPTDIPQVSGNCDRILNKEETLSVSGLKTSSNNSDAALTAIEYAGRNLRVSVTVIRAIKLETRLPSRYSATKYSMRRGTLIHTLKSVVSATPAPHGDL
jgi:hypothetical protein